MCVRRCLSRAKHNTRSQEDDAHGDSKELDFEQGLWGLSVFMSLSQLSLLCGGMGRRSCQPSAGGDTTAHAGLSYRMEPYQIRGSELTLEEFNLISASFPALERMRRKFQCLGYRRVLVFSKRTLFTV